MAKPTEYYTKNLTWAVFTIIDRKNYDDRKSKIHVEALFEYPSQAAYHYDYPNKDVKRYSLYVQDLGRFEEFYNFVQDLKEKYGEKYIFHFNEKRFTVDEENRFRWCLGF
ncbi:MAG: hypothetical protein LUH47_10325 [Clostridiales bacterium]|nr:hypothetical protein [Clostridiales bacterium]